ncbi:MAG: phosphatase PAP2 family protein [Bacteroidetes bacterium]|nr:phosphatase PAP2 family protein [Bacteroidota bacterium]
MLGTAAALHGFSMWRHAQQAPNNLPPPAIDRLCGLDRAVVGNWSLGAHRASNILFASAAAVSLAAAYAAPHGGQAWAPPVMVLESGLLASGLTNSVKELVRRPRPYLHDPALTGKYAPGPKDRLSFWSGHTANTAAITFSTACLVQRSDAAPAMKTTAWITAAAVPACMGYLRMRAGRHFPTDVLVGYAVGAAVGLLVPYVHRATKTN